LHSACTTARSAAENARGSFVVARMSTARTRPSEISGTNAALFAETRSTKRLETSGDDGAS
jgi:hypothetical protein